MRRSGWTRERGTRQTNKTGQDRGPRHAETYSTVGSQSGSAPHWLEAILQAPLKIYTGPGGGGWKACGSDVIQDNWGQTCLSWLQIGRMAAWVIQRHWDVKRPDFSGWGGHVGWGGGMRSNNLFKGSGRLPPVSSLAEKVLWFMCCGKKMIISLSNTSFLQ